MTVFLPLLAPRYAGNVVVRQQHNFVHIALIYATLRSSDSSFARATVARKNHYRHMHEDKNLLALLPDLNEKDLQNIAKAVRRKGRLTNYLHYLKAAAALDQIGLMKRRDVIAALREAASTYPEVLDTIRKLASKVPLASWHQRRRVASRKVEAPEVPEVGAEDNPERERDQPHAAAHACEPIAQVVAHPLDLVYQSVELPGNVFEVIRSGDYGAVTLPPIKLGHGITAGQIFPPGLGFGFGLKKFGPGCVELGSHRPSP